MNCNCDYCIGCKYFFEDMSVGAYDCECPDITEDEIITYFVNDNYGCPHFEKYEPFDGCSPTDIECLEYELEAERKVEERHLLEVVYGGEIYAELQGM